MDLLYRTLLAIVTLCRGVVRATRSALASSDDPEAKSPLLPSQGGLKKRQKSSSTVGQMGTTLESAQPDIVMRLDTAGRLSHSLPIIQETFATIMYQVTCPIFLAGFGMVAAGIYLDMVSKWPVFKEVPELIVLVPALLGLKGNLEMTLASRLSTEANLGNMDNSKEMTSMIVANLVLVQCQATVVGMLSSLVTILLVSGIKFDFSLNNTLLLCACSTVTASIASFFLGLVTSAVIVMSKKLHINPDNIATPIAGSLGDITSLALLSLIAVFFHSVSDEIPYLTLVVIIFYLAVLPLWFWIAKNNNYTKPVLYNGWTPVISAMFISTIGGMLLDVMVNSHVGVAVFQPVINGVGGNLVSIHASRLSTALHQQGELGELPENTKIWISTTKAFFSKGADALTARVLLFLMVPGHIVFAYAINYFKFGDQSLSLAFLLTYLFAALIQVTTLMYTSYVLTHSLWIRKINPDNSTIPYLTAIGDLLGIVLLGLTFEFLKFVGQPMLS